MGSNIEITEEELAFVRSLKDFDLTMFLSEINDHGWEVARGTLALIAQAASKGRVKTIQHG